MFQSDFDERSGSRGAGRLGRLAFVVGEPAEARSVTPRAERDTARQPGDDDQGHPSAGSGQALGEETKWLNERLTACYND